MSYEKELFDEVVYVAAGKISPNDATILCEWVESLEVAKRKADEYEAKAKAWDRTQALLEECTHQTPGDDYDVDWHEFEMKIDEVISDYESGESDAKK